MMKNNPIKQNSPAEAAALLDEYIEMLHLNSPGILALRDKYRQEAAMV